MKSEMMETLVMLVNDRGVVQWANNKESRSLAGADEDLVGATLEDALVRVGGIQQSIRLPDLESEQVIQHFDSRVRTSHGNLTVHWQVVRDRSSRSWFVIGSDYSDIRIREQVWELSLALTKNYLTQSNITAVFEEILEGLLRITDSEYGFMGEINTDENDVPYLKTYALTNIAWDKATHEFFKAHRFSGFEFKNLDTLFGYSIRTGEIVIANEAPKDPRKGGVPHGHPALDRYLGIPVKLPNGELVGLVGLANRPGGYSMRQVDQLKVLLDLFANIIKVKKEETQRKKAQLDLVQAHRMTESVLRALETSELVVITDMNGKILKANHLFCAATGYEESEIIGQNHKLFSSGVHDAGFWEQLWFTIKSGKVWRGEVCNRSKSGELFWLDTVINPILDESNTILQYLSISNLITDRKQTEESLAKAKTAAESSLRAKRIFIANISHELRTPLHAILGMSEQLQKTLLEADDNSKVRMIRGSAQNLLEIINDIIDHTQAEEGKLKLRNGPFNLDLLVRETYELLQGSAEAKGIKFQLNSLCKSDGICTGDAVRLRQVLINIVSNAIKFTEKGTVALDYDCEVTEGGICHAAFTCTDTGIGISDDMQQRIFTQFTQEEEGFQRRYGGSGLGLYISKEIIDRMEGEIQVKSKKGVGTQITIRIPFQWHSGRFHSTRTPDQRDYSSLDLSRKRILLAEDNLLNRELVKMMLSPFNPAIDVVINGQEAIDRINQFTYDLVLMDIQMPDMDGIAAVERIRQLHMYRYTPVIAVTANAIISDLKMYLECGFTDYLTKPFTQHQLLEKITQYLGE
ncbi:MAG: hypothetical protein RJA57_1547 [Bacteroidota bacterium]|jgi:PAS domain S-box-containing protein